MPLPPLPKGKGEGEGEGGLGGGRRYGGESGDQDHSQSNQPSLSTSDVPASAKVLLRSVPTGCEGLSEALIAKVQRKELEGVVEAERFPAVLYARRLKQLPQLAAAIRCTMHTEKGKKATKTVMPVDELLERLRYVACKLTH